MHNTDNQQINTKESRDPGLLLKQFDSKTVLYPVKEEKDSLRRRKGARKILKDAIKLSNAEYNRSSYGLLISSIAAGMELSISLLVIAYITGTFSGILLTEQLNVLKGLGYTVGFIIVILGKSELFTEHTTLAVFPVLAGQQKVKSMMKLWGIIFFGNIVGGYFLGYMITLLGPHLLSAEAEVFEEIALHLTEYPWYIILGSGTFAGWLMGILGWLDIAAKETFSRIMVIALITFIIGIGGLHHSIVGSIEVFAGLVSGDKVGWYDLFKFQIWSTLGNVIGGVIFVGLVKYGHTITALQ